jgi:hypothetical protein
MSRTAGNEADGGGSGSARKVERDEDSGPIAVLVEAGLSDGTHVPVEHIGALTADELDEVTLISDPATRGLASGAFGKDSRGGVDWSVLRKPVSLPPPLPQPTAAEEPARPALKAFYDKLPNPSERAEIHVEDLSLDFTNPFVGSSLLPPLPKKRPWLKPALITAVAGLLVGAGYIGALLNVQDDARPSVERPAIAAPVLQPTAAVVEALPAETPVAPEAPQPMAATQAVHAEPPVAAPAQASAPAPVQPAAAQPQAAALASAPQPVATPPQPMAVTPPAVAGAPRPRAVRPVAQPASAAAKSEPAAPALSAVGNASPAAPAAGSTLSRAQVQIGLESVRASLQTCAANGHGRTMANVTISGAGRVTYASIEGAFAGTPQGSCMARALRAAQFPPFTSAQLRVRYPFAF